MLAEEEAKSYGRVNFFSRKIQACSYVEKSNITICNRDKYQFYKSVLIPFKLFFQQTNLVPTLFWSSRSFLVPIFGRP